MQLKAVMISKPRQKQKQRKCRICKFGNPYFAKGKIYNEKILQLILSSEV